MKLKIKITKRNMIFSASAAVVSILAHFLCGISVFNTALFALLFFAVKNLEIEWNHKYNGIFTTVVIGASAVFTTLLVQYLLLVEDLRGRISNQMLFLNVCCSLVLYLMVQMIVNHLGAACIISHTLLVVFALANYFVYEFRGNELTFADLRTVSTGLSVASNYRFSLNAQAMNVILLSAVFVTGAVKLKMKTKKAWLMRLVCFSCCLLSVFYVAEKTKSRMTETWEQKGTYQNGYLLNFILSIRDSFVEKPKSYSKEMIAGLEQEYRKRNTSAAGEEPAIIVIMNESFADLRVLGDLETNQPVMPFIDSLEENTVRGYALASVYGAKTPNSEWEFLTGGSMAYLPEGSVVYQQYVEEENAYSIVDTLKDRDYTCVAMHPYYDTGWSRDAVYPLLGFDEMYFLDDFDQSNLMRKYVSDEVMFDKIIERYEALPEDENLFLMGVTMQNHGGYTDSYENFVTDVYSTNIPYADVNQYLTLAHQTDLAVEKLVAYFEKAQRPVVICFFGDHQPSLNSRFYRLLNGKGLSGLTLAELEELYEVPFFIWTNFPSESRHVEHTSLNFLSTMLLEQAGIPLPPYHQFLSDLMEEIPAMNGRAYYSQSAGRYYHYEDAFGEDKVWLEKYQILQYNGLFQKKEKSDLFFGGKNG